MPRPVTHLANLDLNLLVALRELLRERSVTRAAERLGVTQPAASASLSRLRRHFGDELLVRDRGEYTLTALGAQLAEQADAVCVASERLFAASADFDPATSEREFTLLMADYTIVVMGRRCPRSSRAPRRGPGCTSGSSGSRCRPSTPRASGSSTGCPPRPRTASPCRTLARPSCSGTAGYAWWTRATRCSTPGGCGWRTWPACPGWRRTTAAGPARRRRPSRTSSSCSASARGSPCGWRATWPWGHAVRTGIIEPGHLAQREPRRCHIMVVLTTALSHRRGSVDRVEGAAVTGVQAGNWPGLERARPRPWPTCARTDREM